MAERQTFFLSLVVLMALNSETATGSDSEAVAVEGPLPSSFSMTSCIKPSVTVRFYEIRVKGSDSDGVYRRVTLEKERLEFAANATIYFGVTNLHACAKAVAAEGFEAFSFNGSCTGYSLHMRFLNCSTGEVVVYVRTDNLADEMSVVPFDEAPKKLVDDGPNPYYVCMAYDVVLMEDEFYISVIPQLQVETLNLTTARERGDFLLFYHFFVDANNCFTDNANGVPTYMDEETMDSLIQSPIYFLDECGKTLQLDASSEVGNGMYSHPGLGCTYYPADSPDECTVTIDGYQPTIVTLATLRTDPNTPCGGLELNITAWSSTSNETETADNCNSFGVYVVNEEKKFDKVTISILKRPTMRVVGFVAYFY